VIGYLYIKENFEKDTIEMLCFPERKRCAETFLLHDFDDHF